MLGVAVHERRPLNPQNPKNPERKGLVSSRSFFVLHLGFGRVQAPEFRTLSPTWRFTGTNSPSYKSTYNLLEGYSYSRGFKFPEPPSKPEVLKP